MLLGLVCLVFSGSLTTPLHYINNIPKTLILIYTNTLQRHEENLALPSAEKAALECVKAGLETWEYKAKNALMYYPEGKDKKIVIKIKNDSHLTLRGKKGM